MKSKAAKILLLIFAVYIGSYIAFRFSHAEVREKDGKTYVIFGSSWSYYFFRPLSYVDGKLSNMNFHIGAHQ